MPRVSKQSVGRRRQEKEPSNDIPLRDLRSDPIYETAEEGCNTANAPHKTIQPTASWDSGDYYHQITTADGNSAQVMNPSCVETKFDDGEDHGDDDGDGEMSSNEKQSVTKVDKRLFTCRVLLSLLTVMVLSVIFLAVWKYFSPAECKEKQVKAGNTTITTLQGRMLELETLDSRMMVPPQNGTSYLDKLVLLEKVAALRSKIICKALETAVSNITAEISKLEKSYTVDNKKLLTVLDSEHLETLTKITTEQKKNVGKSEDVYSRVNSTLKKIVMLPGPQGDQGSWGTIEPSRCKPLVAMTTLTAGHVSQLKVEPNDDVVVVLTVCSCNSNGISQKLIPSTKSQTCEFHLHTGNPGGTLCRMETFLCKKL